MIINFFKDRKVSKDTEEALDEQLNRVIVNVEQKEKRIAFMVKSRLQDFFIERETNDPVAGNIYKGIVRNVLPSIQAAFIDIGTQRNGFIHFSDIGESITGLKPTRRKTKSKLSISDVLSDGQEILVQVTKGAIGQKGVRLSNNASLAGRNLVLIPDSNQRGISRKITSRSERVRMKETLDSLKIPENFGIIVRTAGGIALKKNFIKDIAYLMKTWEEVLDMSAKKEAPCCLYVEPDISIKTLRDMCTENVDEIIVDSKEEYSRIKKYFRHFFPDVKIKFIYYKRKTPIFDVYSIEQELSKIFRRKVWLKCGGHIVIDQTEALVAIDVNSGRNTDHKNLEDTITATNSEAAEEIARQLRLRNIGGLIVIDFIDMSKKSNRISVLKKLEDAVSKDKAKTNILPISELGLIEMTRQRVKESVNQELYENCPHCNGRGMTKSLLSISIETTRKIKRILLKRKEKKIKFTLCPDVYDKLLENNENFQKEIEREFRKKIYFVTDKNLKKTELKATYLTSKKEEVI